MQSLQFTKAITKKPCQAMINGLTSQNLGQPNFKKALEQHANYVQVLKDLNLDVLELEGDENFPDSCFVEDNALITPNCIVISNPGAPSRKGEIQTMIQHLSKFHQNIEKIQDPGTCEPGDIMMCGSHYFIGLSSRTNKEGAEQMIQILKKYNMTGSIVSLQHVLHLKTGTSYLENNNMLVSGEFANADLHPQFTKYNLLKVPDDEAYACNSVWINGTVIIPKGFPKVKQLIHNAGYQTIDIDVSEFQKLDGGLSCLSLRF